MPVIPECTVRRQGLCVSFSNMTQGKKCSQVIIAMVFSRSELLAEDFVC